MHVMLTMPLEPYDGFVKKLEPSSRAYAIMLNGCIDRLTTEGRSVGAMKILCHIDEATMLLDIAKQVHPDAAPYIADSVNLATEQ